MNNFKPINKSKFFTLIEKYRKIQSDFLNEFQVDDIFSNSKIYEIVIANELGHNLIPGHSGSKDAKDDSGRIYEYKHYKETSSNHTWAFNDFSDTTIEGLISCDFVIFAHIADEQFPERFDWYYKVSGKTVSAFLTEATKRITNTRKMINISRNNIEDVMRSARTIVKPVAIGKYSKWLNDIHGVEKALEACTSVTHILTSNKIWEILVAIELNHNVNSEQGGRAGAHDAFDKEGNEFEYKVSKAFSWNFQDISPNVLKKYLSDKAVILAVVNKTEIQLKAIYTATPQMVVKRLEEKLAEKKAKYKKKNKAITRLLVSLSKGDLKKINARQIL
jgi:hypothetical protein